MANMLLATFAGYFEAPQARGSARTLQRPRSSETPDDGLLQHARLQTDEGQRSSSLTFPKRCHMICSTVSHLRLPDVM